MSLKAEEYYTVKNKLGELIDLRENISKLAWKEKNKEEKQRLSEMVIKLNKITCSIVSYNSDENEIKDVELFLLKLLEENKDIILESENEINKQN